MAQSTARRVFVHSVNVDNVIETVNAAWLAFARENDASHLTRKTVVGQPLFRYLDGDETRHLYRLVINRVRSKRQKVTIPFRCDGPTTRRFMEMEISEFDLGKIRFAARILREEQRESVPLFDAEIERTEESIVVCAWCKRVGVEGSWLEVESALAQLKLFNSDHLPQTKQGVCADCASIMRREADAHV